MHLIKITTMVLFFILSYPLIAENKERSKKKPNVIVIVADDLGFGDVGYNGNSLIKTPILDQLSKEGVVLNRFYTASSICSPSRAALLTGRHSYRSGILAAHTAGMRVGEVTIPEVLKENGYATGFFGKWHLGWVDPTTTDSRGYFSPPWFHGFDTAFATKSAVPTWNCNQVPFDIWDHKKGDKWNEVSPYVMNGVPVTENIEGDDSRVIMDRVIPFIEDQVKADKPFCSFVWFHTPHEPVVAGPKYLEMYESLPNEEQRHYYGAITAMDEQIGRLRNTLKALKIDSETVILFTSDNGAAEVPAKKGIASNGLFRGHKHTHYEGGVRVPSIIAWPEHIKPAETGYLSGLVDYFPTIMDLLDMDASPMLNGRPMDGISLLPVLMNPDLEARPGYLTMGYMRLYSGQNGMALVQDNYKLLIPVTSDELELYDLLADPWETNNLAKQMPDKLNEMKNLLDEWNESAMQSLKGGDYKY